MEPVDIVLTKETFEVLASGTRLTIVNYPALKGGASCFMANTCTTEM